MKNFTTIIISVVITLLAAALIMSVTFNSTVMDVLNISDVESFRKAIVYQELANIQQQMPSTETETEVPETNIEKPSDESNNIQQEPEANIPNKDEVVYEDAYIKVSYVKQELSIFGPTIKFLIESKTTETIDISFTDVHIDGYMADTCGVFVLELTEGKKSFETLYLYESDYKDFTSFPSMVEFTIKVQDSGSWVSLAESDTVYIEIQQ